VNPIHVLHPITRLIVGGAQENTMFTAAMLDKGSYQTEIVSGPQTGSEGSLIEEVRDREIRLTILPNMLRQISPINDLITVWKLYRMMVNRETTIVHTHSSKAGILGRIAARLARVPVIVHTVHGWSFHDYMSPTLRRIYIWLERWAAGFSDAMIVVTKRDIEKGLRAGIARSEQYKHIRSAIPLEEFNPNDHDREKVRYELGLPQDAIVIGNVGRFSRQKNPLDWVRVAGEIARSSPNVHFLLVGDGPLRAQVETMLQMEGIEERCVLPGLRRDVPRMMAAMDIFLLTSLWEGLPRVIPQAMAMGLPVIANKADGAMEAIQDGENGFLCQPGDIQITVKHCMDLIKDPQKRRSIGQMGRETALEDFDLNQMINQIDDLYQNLLKEKGVFPD